MDKASLLDELSDSSPSSPSSPSDEKNKPNLPLFKETSFQHEDESTSSSWKSFFTRHFSKNAQPLGDSTQSDVIEKKAPKHTRSTPIDPSSLVAKGSDLHVAKLATVVEETEPRSPGKGSDTVAIDTEQSHLLKRADERQLNNWQAVLHLFKVFTGPSTVGMPAIIRNGGILFGTLVFISIGFLNTYATNVIVRCGRILCKRTGISAIRYDELMEMSVKTYTDTPRGLMFARIFRRITIVMLWMTQFGILALYIQIIGAVFHSQIQKSWPSYTQPLMVTQLFVTLLLIPYSMMTNLKILSWFSLLANVFIGVCVVTMVQFACRNLEPTTSLPLINPDAWSIILFMGASVFTVEGVPMVLPIENRVKYPEDFGGCCGVVTLAATLNISVNLCLGFFGYLAMGSHVPSNFLLALPGNWWYRSISIMYAMMVFLTFTLQLFLPAEFIVTELHHRYTGDKMKKYGYIIVRIGIVILAYLLAALVPNIELVMSLTGSSSSVTCLFILPPIAEMLLQKGEPEGMTVSVVTRSVLCLIFGVLIFTTGTFASIQEIVETLFS